MVGGLLNIISQGDEDIILIGNLQRSFFQKTFTAHTNFGKQKFRIDFEGQTRLNYNKPTTFNFKIPRYADLLQEVFFSFTLPNIWSPLLSWGGTPVMFCSACRTQIEANLPPNRQDPLGQTRAFINDMSFNPCNACGAKCQTRYGFWNIRKQDGNTEYLSDTPTPGGMKWLNKVFPFEFKWIENIGVQAIRSVRLLANNNVLQEFTGQYLLNMVYRDFTDSQKKIFDRMIGNTAELNNPAYYANRNGHYPNAAYFGSLTDKMKFGLEPSIRSRQLFVPINLWSTMNNKTPIPLVSMQFSELRLEVEMRPVNEWWVVKNLVNDLSIKLSGQIKDPLDELPLKPFEILNQVTTISDSITSAPLTPPTSDDFQLSEVDTSIAPDLSGCSSYLVKQPIASSGDLLSFISIMPLTYTAPNPDKKIYNLRYFLKEPPKKMITNTLEDPDGAKAPEIGALPYPISSGSIIDKYYSDVPEPWFADVHLIGCYTFLTDNEQKTFAQNCQSYLIREVHEQNIYDLLGGNNYTPIKTSGLVISWMWFFQRSDIKYRNEWSNYSNYNYKFTRLESTRSLNGIANPYCFQKKPINGKLSDIIWQDIYSAKDTKDILLNWGFYFNSSVREIVLENGIVAWVDRYSRSQGSGIDGVYYYNFCLNTDPFLYQPTGAINISKINTINWEYTLQEPDTKKPPLSTINDQLSESDSSSEYKNIFDPFIAHLGVSSYLSNNISVSHTFGPDCTPTTTNLNNRDKYSWSYTLHIMEERYNILKIDNGVANLVLSRST